MFDNIRPLYDEELPFAMQQITNSPLLAPIAKFVYPEEPVCEIAARLQSIDNIHSLQDTVMRAAISRIIDTSISDFTHTGTDLLAKDKPYLFISNHRDITLDAFLLQYILFDLNDLYITFGANLMQDDIITLIGRANRMFRVERGGTPKEFYRNMLQVSSYIRHIITNAGHSVWIAQRNGRTKNGLDHTEVSLLKMLALSGRTTKDNPLASLKSLNIVPVSISYEWEPCDLLKARELRLRAKGPYKKTKGEDMNSVLTGITQFKGHVHLSITPPLTTDEIDLCSSTDSPFDNLAALVDRRIRSSYFLHPTNYLAYDILHHSNHFYNHYSTTTNKQLHQKIAAANTDERSLLISIYSNPTEALYSSLL